MNFCVRSRVVVFFEHSFSFWLKLLIGPKLLLFLLHQPIRPAHITGTKHPANIIQSTAPNVQSIKTPCKFCIKTPNKWFYCVKIQFKSIFKIIKTFIAKPFGPSKHVPVAWIEYFFMRKKVDFVQKLWMNMEMNADKVVVIGIYSFDNASLKITFVNMYGLVKEWEVTAKLCNE